MYGKSLALAAIGLAAISAQPATAQEIVAPTSATVDVGGPGEGSINDTFNQNGLSSGYTSGVTDFDAYIATNPTHTQIFSGFEWFSEFGATSATVTYDFGFVLALDALALWNEEFSGIGTLMLSGSLDGLTFDLLGTFNPVNSPADTPYGAQVFGFAATDLRFARFEMSGCPQPNGGGWEGCAIGEVAFRTASGNGAIPEPSTWAMMLLGFGAVGFAMRRRSSRAIARFA
jgi:hypothetical protein